MTTAQLAGASAAGLDVIPQPRDIRMLGPGFRLSDAARISVSDTPEDRHAARLLRDSLRSVAGVDCDIVPAPYRPGSLHMLSLTNGAAELPTADLPPKEDRQEGYGLRTDPSGAAVSAETDTGLYYGVQTLVQLAEQAEREKGVIPGLAIADWPSFGMRGVYIEGGQAAGSVVTTRANLEREITLLARNKMNCLMIEIYNLAPFRSFPYCADANTLSYFDWEYLVEFAHSNHVTIIPGLMSLSQMYPVIWACDEGKPYREETAPGLLCPSRPENIGFLRGLYKDLITLFRYSPILAIGCSEVGMQWQARYCPLCRKRIDAGETLHDIHYKHVVNCAAAVEAAARELGREVRPMMWADEFYCGYNGRRWLGIENIPKSVVMGHWQYWSRYQNMPEHTAKDYDGITGLIQRGYDTIFLSASFEFNTYLLDLSALDPKEGKWEVMYDAGLPNIADQAKWAYAHSREGHPGKVLGGGCATFSQHDIRCWDTTWYAYSLQGEYCWGDPGRPLCDVQAGFTDRFAAVFYGARTARAAKAIAAAYRDLDAAKSDIERNNYVIRDIIGEYDIHDAAYPDNKLNDSLGLIDKLMSDTGGPSKSLTDVRMRAERVAKTARSYRSKLAAVSREVDNTYSLSHLMLAARKMENHAKRTLYMLDQQQALRDNAPLGEIRKRLEALVRDTQMIADEVDRLAWGRDSTGYHAVLAQLREFGNLIRDRAR